MISPSTRIPQNPKNSIVPNLIIFESSRFVNLTNSKLPAFQNDSRYTYDYFLIFLISFSAAVKISRGEDKYLFCHNGSLNFKRFGNNCSVLSGSRWGWLWYSRAPLTSPTGCHANFLSSFSQFRWINAAFALGMIMLILFSLVINSCNKIINSSWSEDWIND